MSSNNKSSLAGSDLIQQHPPERGQRNKNHVVLVSGGCCCCCCLHTLGGMIGIAVAGNYRAEAVESEASTVRPKRLPSSQGMFWSSLLAACLASFFVAVFINAGNVSEAIEMTVVFMGMFGPMWFLGASVLSAFQIAVRIGPALQKGYWHHLGKITLGFLVGSVIGILVMLVISSMS